VRHDEGKAKSFMGDEAGTHPFRCPQADQGEVLLPWTPKNQRTALACPAIRGKTFS
jgi:hypothetical protein